MSQVAKTRLWRAKAYSSRLFEKRERPVAQEKEQAFRPEAFHGDHRVAIWKPGVEVVFHRPWDGLFPLFGLAFLFTGPAVYFYLRNDAMMTYSDVLQFTALGAVIGVMGGGVSLSVLLSSSARTVRFDWGERTISVREGSRSSSIRMADVVAIELDCWREEYGDTGPDAVGTGGDRYHCAVRMHLREAGGPEATVPLLEIHEDDQPDHPYREALPLATELALSLAVERRITDRRSTT